MWFLNMNLSRSCPNVFGLSALSLYLDPKLPYNHITVYLATHINMHASQHIQFLHSVVMQIQGLIFRRLNANTLYVVKELDWLPIGCGFESKNGCPPFARMEQLKQFSLRNC